MPDTMPSDTAVYVALLKQAVINDFMREIASIPSEKELAKTLTYSPRHIARMKKLFAAESRREFFALLWSATKKTAAAAAIALAILFGSLMLSPNVRAVVAETIVEWFESFARFQSSQPESAEFETGWRLSYVPEGFEEANVFEDAESRTVSILYRGESEKISFTYTIVDASLSVDNEGRGYEERTVDGLHIYIFAPEDGDKGKRVVWEKEGIRFSLASTISIDELLLMAKSVHVTG